MSKLLYFEPHHLEEALELREQYGPEVIPISGGTDLMLDISRGRIEPGHMLALYHIPELLTIELGEGLCIGSGVNMHKINTSQEVERHLKVLSEATGYVGSHQIRNLATMGGNVCTALPCADSVPPMVAARAEVVIASVGQERKMPVESFIKGPRATVLDDNELVVKFIFPKASDPTGSAFAAHTTREALDLSIVSVAAQISVDKDHGKITGARIALGNVSPAPLEVEKVSEALEGETLSDELVEHVCALAVKSSSARDSLLRASAEYRRELIKVLTRRTLQKAYHRALSGRK